MAATAMNGKAMNPSPSRTAAASALYLRESYLSGT
jgi:hypothetical protein